jgi:hypothetical protein
VNDNVKEVTPISTLFIFCALLIVGGVFYLAIYTHGLNSNVSNETLPVTIVAPPRAVNPADQKYANTIGDKAQRLILIIKGGYMDELSSFVSPKYGLRLSPYANIKGSDQVLSQAEMVKFFTDTSTYRWGIYDGSGLPINLTPSAYYKRFIYDVDFAAAQQVSYNRIIGTGNTPNNQFQFYPNAIIVEYYYTGTDPQYQGMDWRSLRLVFNEDGGVWYLTGIIHDQWTI